MGENSSVRWAKWIKTNTTKISAAIEKIYFIKKNKLNVSTF